MHDYIKTTSDNGGIHINDGIPNRAFYLIATAIGGYAWEKAGRIWYEVLQDKALKSNAQFRDFALLTLMRANRLYGRNGLEAQAVKHGWELVGIKVTGSSPVKGKPGKPKDNTSTNAKSKAMSATAKGRKRP
jgi:Zn-dependent metalloprotease